MNIALCGFMGSGKTCVGKETAKLTGRKFVDTDELIDWFNKNHFDYRVLIEKGLAIDATGLNIY